MSEQIQQLLNLETVPVAVTFHDTHPESISRVEKVEASGCSYWRRAAEGKTFYTEASDHYNCPIGCYTHNVALPDAQMKELENTLGLMGELGYITMEEVPGIPTRETPFKSAVYAPLSDTTDTPDVVIISGYAETDDALGRSGDRCGYWHRRWDYGTTDVRSYPCCHTGRTECKQFGVYRQPRLHCPL